MQLDVLLSFLAHRQLLYHENRGQALDIESFSRGKLRRDSLLPYRMINVFIGVATINLPERGSRLLNPVLHLHQWLLKRWDISWLHWLDRHQTMVLVVLNRDVWELSI